jgi:hypothetical protein
LVRIAIWDSEEIRVNGDDFQASMLTARLAKDFVDSNLRGLPVPAIPFTMRLPKWALLHQ